MKTILITFVLSLSLLAVGAAQKDADWQRLEERRQLALQKQKELAYREEKAVAALRADLAGPWTSVIVAHAYNVSCTGPEYHGFRLKREGGALTVEPWSEFMRRSPVSEPRPITPPEMERLVSETALFYLAAALSFSPWEKAGPMPSDEARLMEWLEPLMADGGKLEAGDEVGMHVRVTTPEGVKRHDNAWALDCPKDFAKWVAAFGTPP